MLARDWAHVVGGLGTTVAELRELCGWSQQALADRSGTSQGAVSRLEAGHATEISLRTVVCVLRALGRGIGALEIIVAPPVHALLVASEALGTVGPVVVLDPELVAFVRCAHRLSPAARVALRQFIVAVGAIPGEVAA